MKLAGAMLENVDYGNVYRLTICSRKDGELWRHFTDIESGEDLRETALKLHQLAERLEKLHAKKSKVPR